MAFKMEVDEEVDVSLPSPIVDDDGDPVTVDHVDWASSDTTFGTVVPNADGLSAVVKSTDQVGVSTITATVVTPDGGSGVYSLEIAFGLAVPTGGELAAGTPRKRT